MENIKRLNLLLRIILILGISLLIIMPLLILFDGKLKIDNKDVDITVAIAFSQMAINVMVTIFILIGIHKLRIATVDFYKHQLFNDVLSKAFKQIGYLVIIGTLSYIVLRWLAQCYFTSEINFHLNFNYLIHASAALFFFTLSTMIDKAKGIQNENNLTI